MNKKRSISLLISLGILALIYLRIDTERLFIVFKQCNLSLLFLSLAMVIPITLATAWRLQFMAPSNIGMGLLESNRLILAASSLNMVLPSKMGDVIKAYFMRDKGNISGSLALSLVVFEKGSDMLSLLFWCCLGLIVYPAKDMMFWLMTLCIGGGFLFCFLMLGSKQFSLFFFRFFKVIPVKKLQQKISAFEAGWMEMYHYFWSDISRLFILSAGSIGIWLLHLLQIWLFILALRGEVPFLTNLALSPLAILAGLLPLTFAGIGTRDAALIYFFAGLIDPETGAALGLLCTSRYFIPALAGLPFLNQYMATVKLATRSMGKMNETS
ncbi:lysylphosphatidylglycerol synthase transmembrane domain-containing protein [Desulfogranum japonicum]|uniref:lysylphosphatidylglycerol synthase transmembrane domain-containing protein n=1 Tax=Desulfogranum japonicum TaxID=231447 RepID=UPI00041D70AB|nr:lysylphosphatidylglycerol synthase transmembrane domain-containing protein [Desulfogranum japonicum]